MLKIVKAAVTASPDLTPRQNCATGRRNKGTAYSRTKEIRSRKCVSLVISVKKQKKKKGFSGNLVVYSFSNCHLEKLNFRTLWRDKLASREKQIREKEGVAEKKVNLPVQVERKKWLIRSLSEAGKKGKHSFLN